MQKCYRFQIDIMNFWNHLRTSFKSVPLSVGPSNWYILVAPGHGLNSPESFQAYFDEALERFSQSDKTIYIMGDFNINLLNAETCNFTKEFLLTLQSYSFIPTIDKPTRVYSSSATLIDNIFANKYCGKITSGNIISGISDHYSQFCLTEFSCETDYPKKTMIRDFSKFSEEDFNFE